MVGAVTPAWEKGPKTKPVELVRDGKAGPSEQEEAGPEKIIRPRPQVGCKMCEKFQPPVR